ncbi:hypothetical protein GW17_00055626 [Ensete ventricosum]|nr:hypothetical protein GW17_00055626 [Ensete ventricosum]
MAAAGDPRTRCLASDAEVVDETGRDLGVRWQAEERIGHPRVRRLLSLRAAYSFKLYLFSLSKERLGFAVEEERVYKRRTKAPSLTHVKKPRNMDVVFETSTGSYFTIEIGFFDTVLEIKEKVYKYRGYPVSAQKLVFEGQELADDRDTEYYAILHHSRIHLVLAADAADGELPENSDGRARITVAVSTPTSRRQLTLEADAADTVARLKERIRDLSGVPPNRFVLFHGSVELQDHRRLADYVVADPSRMDLVMGPSLGAEKLRLMVLPKHGSKTIPVEVNASDTVSELRKEVQRLHGVLNFDLPPDGYFFIYKQNAMEEDKSFRWHDLRPGDTIEIFHGSVK